MLANSEKLNSIKARELAKSAKWQLPAQPASQANGERLKSCEKKLCNS